MKLNTLRRIKRGRVVKPVTLHRIRIDFGYKKGRPYLHAVPKHQPRRYVLADYDDGLPDDTISLMQLRAKNFLGTVLLSSSQEQARRDQLMYGESAYIVDDGVNYPEVMLDFAGKPVLPTRRESVERLDVTTLEDVRQKLIEIRRNPE